MAKRLYSAADERRVVGSASTAPSKEPWRTPWRHDYARILHSASFRRLQGKQQLFPGHESDFFRNRLTHSLEVAQVAKSIAIKLNATTAELKGKNQIVTDIVESAALAHDIGHPPFGHNGEEALNHCMRDAGGFEGNAQTLRILTKLEKKRALPRPGAAEVFPIQDGIDRRAGLDLTSRTLASVLKYDAQIPADVCQVSHGTAKVQKGYYHTEADLVAKIKNDVVGIGYSDPFKTIECSIMDVADDIAYSTYDLEDSFKAGFLSPLEMISATDEIKERVAEEVRIRISKYYSHVPAKQRAFDKTDVLQVLLEIFGQHLVEAASVLSTGALSGSDKLTMLDVSALLARAFQISKRTSAIGYYRTDFTSQLVGKFIDGVRIKVDPQHLPLSRVYLDLKTFKIVEVLKNYAFVSQIDSPKLKVSEYRGKDIVEGVFDALAKHDGFKLLPDDCRSLHSQIQGDSEKKRIICDFIASMTDRYAIQFYDRLYSTSSESIFAPI